MKPKQSQIQSNPKQINPKKNFLQKNKLIEILEDKNSVLSKEVERITAIVEEYDKKKSQKPQLNNRNALLTTTKDPEILSKELMNCYKQIKIYEFQVQKLKSKTLSVEVSDKMMSIDKQLKQKKSIQDRFKQQLNQLIKQIADYSKKLSGNNHHFEVQKQYKSKSDELRFLKQMIKDYETKDSIKQKNLKQEYAQIKSLQKQYIDNGNSISELQELKKNALSQFQQGRLVKRQTKIQNKDLKVSMPKNNSTIGQSMLYSNVDLRPSDEAPQNRTKTNYQNMLNQLNVLQKLNRKYEKQFEESDKVINDIEGKTGLKKIRLEKLEQQIQHMNNSINLKKTCIIPENMKPTQRRLSMKSVNARQDSINISQVRQHNKRRRNIINMTAIMSDREQRLYHN